MINYLSIKCYSKNYTAIYNSYSHISTYVTNYKHRFTDDYVILYTTLILEIQLLSSLCLDKGYKTAFHSTQLVIHPETRCCGLIVTVADDDADEFVLLHLRFPRGGRLVTVEVTVLHFLSRIQTFVVLLTYLVKI